MATILTACVYVRPNESLQGSIHIASLNRERNETFAGIWSLDVFQWSEPLSYRRLALVSRSAISAYRSNKYQVGKVLTNVRTHLNHYKGSFYLPDRVITTLRVGPHSTAWWYHDIFMMISLTDRYLRFSPSRLTTGLLRHRMKSQITTIILAGIPAQNVNKNTWVCTCVFAWIERSLWLLPKNKNEAAMIPFLCLTSSILVDGVPQSKSRIRSEWCWVLECRPQSWGYPEYHYHLDSIRYWSWSWSKSKAVSRRRPVWMCWLDRPWILTYTTTFSDL
jgi:hypothetical protein